MLSSTRPDAVTPPRYRRNNGMQHGTTSCRLSSAVSGLHAPQRCLVLAHLPRLCLAGAGERLSGYSQWTERHRQKFYTTIRKRPSRRRASDHQKKLDRTFLLENFPSPRIEQLTVRHRAATCCLMAFPVQALPAAWIKVWIFPTEPPLRILLPFLEPGHRRFWLRWCW